MAVVNRELDVTEQQRTLEVFQAESTTGRPYILGMIPHPCSIQSAKHHALGLSGSPTATLQVARFVIGAGFTTFAIGPALTVAASGTSGFQSLGVSSANLQTGDILQVATGGANSALTTMHAQVVIRALQDIKSWN